MPAASCGQAGAPSGVGGEEVAEVSVRNLAVVSVEGAIRGLLLRVGSTVRLPWLSCRSQNGVTAKLGDDQQLYTG